MGLERLLISGIVKAVKSTSRFGDTLDNIISRFEQGCPPKEQLIEIISTKNQALTALQTINTNLNTLDSTFSTVKTVLNTLSVIVTTVKSLPAPVSVPPGVGIPLNIITKLSDVLDTVGDKLKKNKGLLKVVPQTLQTINSSIQPVLVQLQTLDVLLQACINSAVENMTEEEKNDFINELNFSLTQTGNFSDPNVNENVNDALLDRLKPNSNNPLIYKNFKLEIQFDAQNQFSFPSRRIKATNIIKNSTISKVYNTAGSQYSYSATTSILVEETKFRIDRYLIWLKNKFPSLYNLITQENNSIIFTTPSEESMGDGGLLNNSTPTTTISTTPDYTPFTSGGTVPGEVRFKGGQAWRWLGGSINKWAKHTTSLLPIGVKGKEGEERFFKTDPPNPYPRKFYKWSEIKYKWEYQSTATGKFGV